VGVQYAIGPAIIQWVFKIDWVTPESVSPEFAAWLRETCSRSGIPEPRFGIIREGRPNAFTFGHHPGDARVVVTEGVLDMLSQAEVHGVVAHELGHIRNWDFVVMTLASAVPLVLYTLYVFTRTRRGRDNGGYVAIIAISAYVAWIVSQYIVLLLSRVREYYADEFSAKATKDPNGLSSALVTIAYGLARTPAQVEPADKKEKAKARSFDWARAAAPLGIASPKLSVAFAASASDASGNFSIENMRRAMRWELANPWAKLFEIASTHPLTARRIQALQKLCPAAHEAPSYPVEAPDVEPYGSRFGMDVLMLAAPWLGALVGLAAAVPNLGQLPGGGDIHALAFVPLLAGVGWLVRLSFEYRSQFTSTKVVSLVGETNVSHVRGIPAEVRGKVIGRGVPGLFFSEDLVLQDDGGFIMLDYRQPLRVWELLFGALKAERFIGHEAVVRGWYRRAPTPFVEVKEMIFDTGDRVRCYHYPTKLVLAALLVVVGLVMAVLPV
jgi:Zn-dependent protease with chaperone function